MRFTSRIISLIIGLLIVNACQENQYVESGNHNLNPGFGDYWYQGKAEIATFSLEQARYGEIRKGEAVLIFVTEDFSESKQVKLDDPMKDESDILKVLKLNATRKFVTGVYPYSTMTSVFTPIYQNHNDQTVKLATSIQEWCGQTYLQANLKNDKYYIQGHSYFESEGQQEYEHQATLMEDEIWNRIRLNPDELPTGAVELLPGSLFCRLSHKTYKAYEANLQLEKQDDGIQVYRIQYPQLNRSLTIRFKQEFPHQILGWEENYPDGGKMMTTKASLIEVNQLDYWNKNRIKDEKLRSTLGLQ